MNNTIVSQVYGTLISTPDPFRPISTLSPLQLFPNSNLSLVLSFPCLKIFWILGFMIWLRFSSTQSLALECYRAYQNVLWWLMHQCHLREESICSEIPGNSYTMCPTIRPARTCWTHKALNARFDWVTEAYVSLSKYILSFQCGFINL